MVEELKSQTNVSTVPVNSNLPFDNDAYDGKQTNKYLEKRTIKAS